MYSIDLNKTEVEFLINVLSSIKECKLMDEYLQEQCQDFYENHLLDIHDEITEL